MCLVWSNREKRGGNGVREPIRPGGHSKDLGLDKARDGSHWKDCKGSLRLNFFATYSEVLFSSTFM